MRQKKPQPVVRVRVRRLAWIVPVHARLTRQARQMRQMRQMRKMRQMRQMRWMRRMRRMRRVRLVRRVRSVRRLRQRQVRVQRLDCTSWAYSHTPRTIHTCPAILRHVSGNLKHVKARTSMLLHDTHICSPGERRSKSNTSAGFIDADIEVSA